MQDRVAMKKRAPAAVLADKANIAAITDDRGISHRFGKAPVHLSLAGSHAFALVHNALHPPVELHVRRNAGQELRQFANGCRADRGINFGIPLGTDIRTPVDGELIANHA